MLLDVLRNLDLGAVLLCELLRNVAQLGTYEAIERPRHGVLEERRKSRYMCMRYAELCMVVSKCGIDRLQQTIFLVRQVGA
jgi:hypothetical protein